MGETALRGGAISALGDDTFGDSALCRASGRAGDGASTLASGRDGGGSCNRADERAIEAAMRRAIELAALGPVVGGNPQVGCVLLAADGRPVAEGFHRGAGTAHAEVAALADAARHGVDPRGLTAVVSLEPCGHEGRTGACARALVEAGIARVRFGAADRLPGHGGAGALAAAGVDVLGGVLRAEAEAGIRPWLTAARRGRSWLTVKWAASLDGRVAAADGSSTWITGPEARARVHLERAANDAVLVGTGTVLADDPALTARTPDGALATHQPLPVVVGRRAVPAGAALRSHPAGLVATSAPLDEVLRGLWERGAALTYLEGGPTLASAAIAAGLADELSVYLAPKLLGAPGLAAIGALGIGSIGDALDLELDAVERLGPDLHLSLTPRPRTLIPRTPATLEGPS